MARWTILRAQRCVRRSSANKRCGENPAQTTRSRCGHGVLEERRNSSESTDVHTGAFRQEKALRWRCTVGSSACRGIAEFIGSETRPGLVPVERFAATWGAAVLRPYGRRRQAGLDWGAGEPRLRMGEGYSSKAAARPPHSILG